MWGVVGAGGAIVERTFFGIIWPGLKRSGASAGAFALKRTTPGWLALALVTSANGVRVGVAIGGEGGEWGEEEFLCSGNEESLLITRPA